MRKRPIVVAEVGINAEGSMARVERMICMAKTYGADYVKFQLRNVDKSYPADYLSKPKKTVFGDTVRAEKEALELSTSDLMDIADICKHQSIKWFATPRDAESAERSQRHYLLTGLAFFAVGIYGGFVQAGVGFFILAVTSAVGLNLVRGNAVKVLTVLCFTALSLALFAWQGKVDWLMGLTLAAGTIIGGLVGARLTVLKGHRWVRGVVTVTIILFALKLWFGG